MRPAGGRASSGSRVKTHRRAAEDVGEEKHHPGGVRTAGARLPDAPQAGVQGPREQGALHRQERFVQLGAQEHPRAGPLPAGRVHHAGRPEMALHAGHLHHDLRQQLAALRHELVAGGVRARRPGPGAPQRDPLRHRRQVRGATRHNHTFKTSSRAVYIVGVCLVRLETFLSPSSIHP